MSEPTPLEIEAGRLLFAQACEFVLGAARLEQIPPSEPPEVAFAGRSNVGKSSLVNALTGRKTLARVSNTPGRTQQINFFVLGGRLMLADLPGYGFAAAPRAQVKIWTRLTQDYLRGRRQLRRVCLLVDARHGLKDADHSAIEMMDAAAVAYQVVLTKIDKVGAAALAEVRQRTADEIKRHTAAHPDIVATSAEKSQGIELLRAELAALAVPL